MNGDEYEYASAEVIDVDYSDIDSSRLYKIRCKLIGAFGSQPSTAFFEARPLHSNIKHIPIVGEIVLVTKSTGPNANAASPGQEYYYTQPISIQSNVHHNGLPGVTDMPKLLSPRDNETRKKAQDGNTIKTKDKGNINKTIDAYFPERNDVYPIQPYPGDIIFEGRWGQSIRFGSTIDEDKPYPVYPSWTAGAGASGNPITIISNGTNPPEKLRYNKFVIENIDKDDSSIWLTSKQTVRFTPASRFNKALKNNKIDSYRQTKSAGNQIIIASDRIVLNAKENEIIGYSKIGVGFSTDNAVTLDAKNAIEMEAAKINLGVNAVEPALLGNKTIVWLNELCKVLAKVIDGITQAQFPTALGPTGYALNLPTFLSAENKLKSLKNELDSLASKLVFLNAASGGPSDEELASANAAQDHGSIAESKGPGPQQTSSDSPPLNEFGEEPPRNPEESDQVTGPDDSFNG